jgi:hypothetical protein
MNKNINLIMNYVGNHGTIWQVSMLLIKNYKKISNAYMIITKSIVYRSN